MIDFITKYWLEVVFGTVLAGLGTAFSFLSKRVSKRIEEQDAIKLGIVALLRDRIIALYNHYINKGYCPIYARENIHSLYEQYKNLGGNGTVPHLIAELEELPTDIREETE